MKYTHQDSYLYDAYRGYKIKVQIPPAKGIDTGVRKPACMGVLRVAQLYQNHESKQFQRISNMDDETEAERSFASTWFKKCACTLFHRGVA
jgi:hypothetical protein